MATSPDSSGRPAHPEIASHPILSAQEAGEREKALFRGEEGAEWDAMQRAGAAVGTGVLRDFSEIGGFPPSGRLLVLVGKGHNGGDALIAARRILGEFPAAQADVEFVYGERSLRPLTQRAWRELLQSAPDRIQWSRPEGEAGRGPAYDASLDGVFGFSFRPPLDPAAAAALSRANALPVRLRAAVDLPSGLDEPEAFRADFTYATGMVKASAVGCGHAGRLRYLDLGFFGEAEGDEPDRVLLPSLLAPLAALRPSASDKRSYGHLGLVGGSRHYPGAILMATRAALRSGAGLVTAFVPESLAPAFAAQAPEAMWVGCPETPDGGLALEGRAAILGRLGRASALLAGPGLSREEESFALVAALLEGFPGPALLDADALQSRFAGPRPGPLVLTPHAGEYARLAGGRDLRSYAAATGATVILKGPVTKVCGGRNHRVYHSFFGGPALARGGSGDVLAGLGGGLLAQTPEHPALAACRAAVWHGLAADALARARGQVAVGATELIEFLPAALRGGDIP